VGTSRSPWFAPGGDRWRLSDLGEELEIRELDLVDPAAMLGAISARLAPGGKLFITAPFRPIGWKPSDGIAGWRDYSYLHVPAHITYFSRQWFERMAPMRGLDVAHWNADHEEGQAFELVLVRV
jgi:hypothetical protein